MKSFYAALATGAILAAAAMAQEEHVVFDKMVPQIKLMGLQGSIMGKTVKGAPYSAVEVTENTQMLADGTRIHNESQTQVYRDSDGRMRRETPTEITIWDPVANSSWVLNPKEKTARKLPMGNFVFTSTRTANGETATYVLRSDEKGFRTSDETRVVEQKLAAAREADLTKMKAELDARMRQAGPAGGGIAVAATAGPNGDVMRRTMVMKQKMNTDQLGKRTIEGMSAEGTRMTATIEAGAIGNDRAINTVTERWFSPELQTVMMTRTTDPRSGEESFKLVNVNRSEPASYLFQVPAGYQVIEAK